MFSLFVVKRDSVSLHNLDYPSLGICTVVAYDGCVNWGCFVIVSLVLWLAYSFVNMLQLPLSPKTAASAGNTIIPGAIVLLLSLLGSRYCTL